MGKKKVNIQKRMLGFYLMFAAIIVLLVIRTGYLTIISGPALRAEAEEQQTRDSLVSPKRGTIYDRNRKVLAQSASAEMVCVVPVEIKEANNAEEVASALSEILGLEYDEVYAKTQKNSYYEIVKKKVEEEDAEKIRALNIKGIRLDEDTKRYYPGGTFASHIIGFTGDDNQGLGGVELVCDNELKGVSGRIRTAKNANGLDMPYEYEQYEDPIAGSDVVLCIDEVIQHFTEKHLEDARIENAAIDGAAAIVMNPKTGEILAMVTKPDYDLNSPMTIKDETVKEEIKDLEGEEYKKRLSEELNKIWRNKAVVDTYEPGSTFKALVAAAALDEGTSSFASTFYCKGSKAVSGWQIRCHKTSGHGSQNFVEAVYNSCNPAFIEIGLSLGVENFSKYFRAFGFAEKTGFDLPGEAVGSYHKEADMKTIDLATSSFGQSFTVTPIQMITALSVVANGGYLMKPYVVKQVIDAEGNITKNTEPTVIRQVISEETSRKMREVLEGVVSEGGGKNAYVAGYRVAGKTGTSEKLPRGSRQYVASFLGFAPADNPQIAVIVLLDNPKGGVYYGGMIAAPVVGKIIEDSLRYMGVEPQYTDEEMRDADVIMPETRGKTVNEAKMLINEKGLKYQIIGDGETVVDQTPKPGMGLSKGSVGILYTKEQTGQLMVTVPDLSNMSISDCNYTLANASLNFKISGPGKADYSGGAYAKSQNPAPGTEVPAGTVVYVEFRHASIE